MREGREAITPDLQPRPSAGASHKRLSVPANKTSSGVRSSATWTSTSGDLGGLSDTDEIGDRQDFVEEYNRIAKKYGIRPLVPDNTESLDALGVLPKRGWWSRTFRRTSSQSTEHSVRRQRSTSHVMSHIAHPKRDSLRDQDLQGLVRLCGKSFLYLPPEYSPGSLILPTCFRATAQYLVQHAPETRGVFRIPGSVRVVNALYEFYCADQALGEVANTVRSPNLPFHINAGIHDVASCFKKFLAGLPGGILGSLSLFDALVAINSQLYCDPEFSRTKQTKIRARLIALAVGTLRSQFRRELICAVFGLLCLLGRAAEIAPREDELGRPLPTSDLMGYNALGIVFGPLLVGDILGSHAVKLSDPSTGLFIVTASGSPKSKKERKRGKESYDESTGQQHFLDVDKIHIANDITEMLITNWRDVVRQMRNMDGGMSILRRRSRTSVSNDEPRRSRSFVRYSEHETSTGWVSDRYAPDDRPASPGTSHRAVSFRQRESIESIHDSLSVRKTRPKSGRPLSNLRGPSHKITVLSPPKEEPVGENQDPTPMHSSPLPRKSSLKPPSKTTRPKSIRERAASFENLTATSNELSPPHRSPSRITGRVSPIKTYFGFLPKHQTVAAPIERPTSAGRSDRDDVNESVESLSGHAQTNAAQLGRSRSAERADSDDADELFESQSGHQDAAARVERPRSAGRRDRDELDELCDTEPRHHIAAGSSVEAPRSVLAERRDRDDFQPNYHATAGPHGLPRPSDKNERQGFQSRFQTNPALKDTPRQTDRRDSDESSEFVCLHRCRSTTPKSGNRPTTPKAMTQVDGSPDRQQPSGEFDPMVAYRAGPGVKILNAPSTLRSQPKIPQTDLDMEQTKTQAGVHRRTSRGSTSSECADNDEPLKKSNACPQRGQVAPDQMDGAADFFLLGSSGRGSFMDLRGEFEGKGNMDSQRSCLPVSKSRPHRHAVLTKKNGPPKTSLWTSPRKTTPRSAMHGQIEVKPVASKVRGLAAMFDTAAKASPLLPTPGGAIQKKRRETARVISPYTSNPSPRASVTSVSTPVALMSQSRIGIDLARTGESSGRRSMIPRLQNLTATDSTGATKRHFRPASVRRDEPRFSLASSNAPSRIPTPSRLPVDTATAAAAFGSPPLSQFDGTPMTVQFPMKLTAQQEILPVAYHSSPMPQARASGGYKVLPRLSQHSNTSDLSEGIVHSGESSPMSPHPNHGRSASSLRDQIRSLRMELSSKNEDCAQLRLELEESRKAKQVSEILLREDLECAKAASTKWRRRAEKAERNADSFEKMAMKIEDSRDRDHHRDFYHRGQAGDAADDYSFNSGSDHIDTAETPPKPLFARMNQSIRRTPPANGVGANGASSGGGDGFSECSSSTVVRNVGAGAGDDSAVDASWLGGSNAVEEFAHFTSPGMVNERL